VILQGWGDFVLSRFRAACASYRLPTTSLEGGAERSRQLFQAGETGDERDIQYPFPI